MNEKITELEIKVNEYHDLIDNMIDHITCGLSIKESIQTLMFVCYMNKRLLMEFGYNEQDIDEAIESYNE